MALARKPKRERGRPKPLFRPSSVRAVPTTRTTWLLEAVAEKLAAVEGD